MSEPSSGGGGPSTPLGPSGTSQPTTPSGTPNPITPSGVEGPRASAPRPSAPRPPAPPPRPPDAFDRFGERVSERVNPIVVKEVRQGLRTRTFWIFFALMLLACLVIALIAFAASDGGADRTGQYTFIAIFVSLSLVQFFVIPYTAYRSMAREREEETWVLLTLTGLGPRRILAGKIGSFILQGMLYASAALPFMLFSYYLNGIDLPTILAAIVVAAGYQVFLVAVSVSTATLAESRIVRALLHFVLLGFLFQALIMGITTSVGVAESARRMVSDAAFWLAAGSTLFGLVTTGLLLFESAAARLSLPTESYAFGSRVMLVLQGLGGAALFAVGGLLASDAEVYVVGGGMLSLYVAVVGTLFGSDRDGMARNHWARAGRWSLFRPGALRAFVLLVLVLLVGVGGLFALATAQGGLSDEGAMLLLTAAGLALLYLSAANIVARWIPHPPWQTAAMVRILFIALVVFGSGVPPLVGQLAFEDADNPVLNAFNPVMAMVSASKHGADTFPLVLMLWGVAFGVAAWCFFVLRRRDVETHA